MAITDLANYVDGDIKVIRVDMGTEWTSYPFRMFCASAGIRIEYTAPNTPQQNAPVESAIWRLMKGGTVCRRAVGEQFGIDFSTVPGLDARGDRLWLESVRYMAGCLNRSGTKANPGNMSPHEALTGKKPDAVVVPFFQPAMMRVTRASKLDDQSEKAYFLGQGRQHGASTVRLLKASTGRVCHSRDIVWISGAGAAPAGEGGSVLIPAATLPAFGPEPPPLAPPPQQPLSGAPPPRALPPPPSASATPPPAPSPQQPLSGAPPPPPSSALAPPPLNPPPQPRLSGTGWPATPPLTSPPPMPSPQSHALLPGTAGPCAGSPPEETPLPRPAGVGPPPPRRANEGLISSRLRSGGRRNTGDATRSHNLGLLSLSSRDVMRSALAAMDAASAQAGGAKQGEEQVRPVVSPMVAGGAGAAGGVPCALVTRFARREDIDIAIMNQRPPHDRPELPQCRRSDLRVPKTFAEATSPQFEHRNLFMDAMIREFHGLLSAGTFTVAN